MQTSRIRKLVLSSLILGSATVHASDKLSVSQQAVLKVPASMAWALLGDFNGLNRWHPAVANSDLQGKGDQSGARRVLTLGNGAQIKETLLDYNDGSMSYQYKITESPLPVSDYVSTISVSSNEQGYAVVSWSSEFDAKDVPDEKAMEVIGGVYSAGLDALKQLY